MRCFAVIMAGILSIERNSTANSPEEAKKIFCPGSCLKPKEQKSKKIFHTEHSRKTIHDFLFLRIIASRCVYEPCTRDEENAFYGIACSTAIQSFPLVCIANTA